MQDLGSLAAHLTEATDASTLGLRLAEHLRRAHTAGAQGAAVRVWTLGEADRCATCSRRAECPVQDRCLHLVASDGAFDGVRVHDERLPRTLAPFEGVLGQAAPIGGTAAEGTLPAELAGGAEGGWRLHALEAAGEVLGVVGVRADAGQIAALDEATRLAACLAASSLRLLQSLETGDRRHDLLLLVNELGRKVNAILDDDLLLRQAASDIHRVLGFPNVMVFTSEPDGHRLRLRAQAGVFPAGGNAGSEIGTAQGIVGRAFREGGTQIIDDVGAETTYVCWYPDTRSEIAVPISNGGTVMGVLNVESDRTSAFGPTDRLVLETLANQLATALDNARLFALVKEREDRYQTLVESSPVAVMHLTPEGRVTYANPAAETITGVPAAELTARPQGLATLVPQGDRARVQGAIRTAAEGRATPDIEVRVLHTDGEVRWITASLRPLARQDGHAGGVVLSARDRTREKELQDRLNQSEKLSAIGTLVSGVAHELNNPLAGILGYSQLLLARDPGDWSRADVEKIEHNARRCQRIVENLLAFARQRRMTKRRACINDVIEGVLNLNEYQLRMDNIDVTRDFDPLVPSIPLDVNRWQQVFVNLASNAHQALLESPRTERRLHFATRRVGETLIVRVVDNGPGVPQELRHRIFEPFFTTRESGTGLGLGICFGIVQEHGGSIEIDPSVVEGTTIVIELPLGEHAEMRVPVPQEAAQIPRGGGRRVLVVDDDSHVCEVVRRTLEHNHYEVTIAHDGEAALDLALKGHFHALLADVRMPGRLNGLELYRATQKDVPALASRFIFMTGNLTDGPMNAELTELGVRCIEKPFDIDDLAQIVHDVVGPIGD